jgi:hypothetical protein
LRHIIVTIMSFDLMVFEPTAPPPDRKGFLDWYRQQCKWEETHGYNNPEVCTPALRAWFMEMITQYPPMNGPLRSDDVDNPKVTDYSVGQTAIYGAFAWSKANDALKTLFDLAKKHRVGFFDVSSNEGGVWMPQPDQTYRRVHGEGKDPT